MSYIDLERGELMTGLEAAGKRFTALLRSLAPGDEIKPCEGLIWNVGDVAVHVLTVVRRSLGDRRRTSSPAELAQLNALGLNEIPERDPHKIAELIDADMDIIIHRVYPKVADDRRFPFHSGTTIGARQALAITLGEFTLHGWDIAHACGKEWVIDPHIAALAWRGFLDPLHAWLKKDAAADLSESYLFELEGEEGRTRLCLTDGTLHIEYNVNRSDDDFVIRIHPVDLLFVFPYGRRPAADAALARLAALFETI